MKEAFDLIKERLEEKKGEHLHDEKVMQGLGKDNLASFCSAKAMALDGAIQIVSEVEAEYADKVCEYEEHIAPSKEFYYLTACKNRWNGRLHGCRPYCPYCGKKIKVVER